MNDSKAANGPHQKKAAESKAAKQAHGKKLAAILAVTDPGAARKQWLELRDQLTAADAKRQDLVTKSNAEDKLRVKAAQAEDYPTAQKHKEKKDELATAAEALRAERPELLELRNAAQKRFSELYFTDAKLRRMGPESVTVYRVRVYDPETDSSDTEVYVSDSQSILLTVGDQSFDNEAGRVERWASDKGFLCLIEQGSLML